ncbi:hypothetical protein HY29_02880 [Hyphomonas beringensis]|uniref:NYN domain-containing protein n=2 Tax=Hyphomonas beringensis TaxID=1280946 RepID=A0A062UBN5_9PROT|nr:hypothetical protein HY29_02880 [Hyphomonas beringensis]
MMFVDGFNLYHPLAEYAAANNMNHIKWLNLHALGEAIAIRRKEIFVGATYCTAYQTKDQEAKTRHKLYNDALRAYGVKIEQGHYMNVPTKLCGDCGMMGEKPTEKQTDINVALSLFRAAWRDEYDVAYLLSVDSDQAATARHFADEFKGKSLVSVAPPGKPHSNKVLQYNGGLKVTLTIADILKARLPNAVLKNGKPPIVCPRDYLPVNGT